MFCGTRCLNKIFICAYNTPECWSNNALVWKPAAILSTSRCNLSALAVWALKQQLKPGFSPDILIGAKLTESFFCWWKCSWQQRPMVASDFPISDKKNNNNSFHRNLLVTHFHVFSYSKESVCMCEVKVGKRKTLFLLPSRPTPEEAAQWRESLDRVLNNSCKWTYCLRTLRKSYTSAQTLTLTPSAPHWASWALAACRWDSHHVGLHGVQTFVYSNI